jgi:hypothetical protein
MIVTERGLRFQETIDMLRSAGYQSIGRLRLSRYQMLAVFTIAVNQIAWLTNRVPYRVYQAILFKLYSVAQGTICCPSRQGQGRAQGHQDADDLHVWCPHCGFDLLAAGPLEPAEIVDSMAKRTAMRGQSPQKSPHSPQNEGKVLPSVGNENAETGNGSGVRGTGGGDPTGAPLPLVLPHSPQP